MILVPGTRLGGVYEVIAQIGEGGMGQVYRATDTKLKRQVAIKILSPLVAADPDRLARFQREAEVLASINHPNISAIYGLEDADGVKALVMELVEGEDLAQRIARGAIPIDEALPIARQIAEALEAAHEQGIIHRDLKPANIKVRPDGTVKVLDFGLAKAMDPPRVAADVSQSPTITSPAMTSAGIILGTAAYMSPDQARGKVVDARTDIWAFGCVVYEMLTGRRSFGGDTTSDIIASILGRDPDWAALPSATPPSVRRLLVRCLDKDRRRRLQHIGDARIEIEDALSKISFGPATTPVAAPERSSVSLLGAIAVVTSIAALLAVGAFARGAWTTPRAQRAAGLRISRLTMAASGAKTVTATSRGLAFTPDGGSIVYVGNNGTQVFVRPFNELDATAIAASTAPVSWVCVSPDGQWVGFVDGNVLKKVAITGGPVVTIAAPVSWATWAMDETIIVATGEKDAGLQRVSAAGGQMTTLTRPEAQRGEFTHMWPEMLPGGRAVLFTIAASTGGTDASQVAVLDLATSTSKVLVRGGGYAHYAPSGHLVYRAGGTLRAVPFDLARLETHGTASTVLPRLESPPQSAGNFDVATDGTLAYIEMPELSLAVARTLVWVDRQGREEPLAAPVRAYTQPRLSPDGTRVAVVVGPQTSDIWVWDIVRQTLSRRTFDPSNAFFPLWTPDGRRLIFASVPRLFWQLADGRGVAEPLGGELPSGGIPSAVTPDGTRLLFQTNLGNRDVMTLMLDRTQRIEPLLNTSSNERNAVVSRDGHWLAYESDSSGRFEIYVRPFPDTQAGQSSISSDGGLRPVWAPNGQELFYEEPGGALMSVPVDARGDTWSAGSPARVVKGPYLTQGGGLRNYDISADGRRFLMVKHPADYAAPQIVVVQNWLEELNRIVPTK